VVAVVAVEAAVVVVVVVVGAVSEHPIALLIAEQIMFSL